MDISGQDDRVQKPGKEFGPNMAFLDGLTQRIEALLKLDSTDWHAMRQHLHVIPGLTVPRACFSTKPLSSPWLVMKARQASPPAVRSALDTFAAVATGSDGFAPGSEVSARMSRTPRATSLARIAATPLSKAGLLLSPAISTTRQRSAGTTPSESIAICCEVRAEGGGAAACSGVQAAANRKTSRSAFRRTDI
jgi:hypothetical protein